MTSFHFNTLADPYYSEAFGTGSVKIIALYQRVKLLARVSIQFSYFKIMYQRTKMNFGMLFLNMRHSYTKTGHVTLHIISSYRLLGF